MGAQLDAKESLELHEGSWAYLSLSTAEGLTDDQFFQHIIGACESSGWPALIWSPSPRRAVDAADFERFVEGMSHAIAHADLVVAFIDGSSELADMELEFACEHRRPIIALRLSGRNFPASNVQEQIRSYDRIRVIECDDAEGCVACLRETLSNPEFSAIVEEALGEPLHHV